MNCTETSPSLVTVCFIRDNGRRVARGFVADVPFNCEIAYTKPFIVVQVDAATIPAGIMNNNTVRLKLDSLMEQYPRTEVTYADEDGNEHTRTIEGYFNIAGRSAKPYPVITMGDVTYE